MDRDNLKEINDESATWFETTRSNGLKVLYKYAKTREANPASLDIAFNNWKTTDVDVRAPDEIIIYGLGVLFGDYMVAQTASKWVEVDDDSGAELAILFGSGDVAYPIDSVSKRIPTNEFELSFFEPIWFSIKGQLDL